MRKMGWMLAGLGAITGAALLSGCGDDHGRLRAMLPQDDYLSQTERAPAEGSATGGSGTMGDSRANELWLKQDFRVPYPPDKMEALVAPNLGTGKPLRANAKGVWVQGIYSVEVGSGITPLSSPTSAPYQPQERPVGNFSTPRSLPAHNSGN